MTHLHLYEKILRRNKTRRRNQDGNLVKKWIKVSLKIMMKVVTAYGL